MSLLTSCPFLNLLFIFSMTSIIILDCCLLVSQISFSQYTWKLEKNKDGIQVYTSPSPTTSYKSVRVECTFKGTYAKLISILTNVKKFEDWIYHTKTTKLIRKNNHYDFVYYSETSMPWPLSNRDVVLRLNIRTDSLPKFLIIEGRNMRNELPEMPYRVRVPHYLAKWKVTMPSAGQLQISYILDVNPGGSIPAGVVNLFVDKGPYETFLNLKEELIK